MAAKKIRVSAEIRAKARRLLEVAEERARQASDWIELHFSLFRVGGLASELFPTEPERAAFLRTPESKQINALMDTLPEPPLQGVYPPPTTANGAEGETLARRPRGSRQ